MYKNNEVQPFPYVGGIDHIPQVKRYSQIESDVLSMQETNVCF